MPNTVNSVASQLLSLARNGINWDTVIDCLVQSNSQELLDAVMATHCNTSWEYNVIQYSRTNGIVENIKFMRKEVSEKKGYVPGLKESKDWIEANCPNGGKNRSVK